MEAAKELVKEDRITVLTRFAKLWDDLYDSVLKLIPGDENAPAKFRALIEIGKILIQAEAMAGVKEEEEYDFSRLTDEQYEAYKALDKLARKKEVG
jgi:hypothetical protein